MVRKSVTRQHITPSRANNKRSAKRIEDRVSRQRRNREKRFVALKKNPAKKLSQPHRVLNTKKLALILLLIFVVGVGLTYSYYMLYYVTSMREIPLRVMTSNNTIGFNNNVTKLDFGKIPVGGGATKYFSVQSDFPRKVHIAISGNISPFIALSDNNFIIDPTINKSIEVYIDIPENYPIGYNYSGMLKVYFYRTSLIG